MFRLFRRGNKGRIELPPDAEFFPAKEQLQPTGQQLTPASSNTLQRKKSRQKPPQKQGHIRHEKAAHKKKPAAETLDEKELVDGYLHWVSQRWLKFGRDAKVPRDTRPAMIRTRRGPTWPLMPSTSGGDEPPLDDPEFFCLRAEERSMHFDDTAGFQRGEYKAAFYLCCQYENLSADLLGLQIGRPIAEERMRIQQWLLGRSKKNGPA